MEQPPISASAAEWEEWCRVQRELHGPPKPPGLRALLASLDPSAVMGTGVLALVFVVIVMAVVVSASPDSNTSEGGMVHSCNRSLLADSPQVDYRESDATRWEENLYLVTLRDEDGADLGECRVEVTRDTYRVSAWDWAPVRN